MNLVEEYMPSISMTTNYSIHYVFADFKIELVTLLARLFQNAFYEEWFFSINPLWALMLGSIDLLIDSDLIFLLDLLLSFLTE